MALAVVDELEADGDLDALFLHEPDAGLLGESDESNAGDGPFEDGVRVLGLADSPGCFSLEWVDERIGDAGFDAGVLGDVVNWGGRQP